MKVCKHGLFSELMSEVLENEQAVENETFYDHESGFMELEGLGKATTNTSIIAAVRESKAKQNRRPYQKHKETPSDKIEMIHRIRQGKSSKDLKFYSLKDFKKWCAARNKKIQCSPQICAWLKEQPNEIDLEG